MLHVLAANTDYDNRQILHCLEFLVRACGEDKLRETDEASTYLPLLRPILDSPPPAACAPAGGGGGVLLLGSAIILKQKQGGADDSVAVLSSC